MFDGFREYRIPTGDNEIFALTGGSGPPLPSVIDAVCEDYRAGATVDLDDDRADRENGRRLQCPTLVLWGRQYLSAKASSPLEVWKAWADHVSERVIDCGHFIAEEQPAACAEALLSFFVH